MWCGAASEEPGRFADKSGEDAGCNFEGAAAGGDSSVVVAEERCLRLVGALGAGGTAGSESGAEGAGVGGRVDAAAGVDLLAFGGTGAAVGAAGGDVPRRERERRVSDATNSTLATFSRREG